MNYTIISVHNLKYKNHSKKDLFNLIDDYGMYRFLRDFGEYFYISGKNSNFLYKKYKTESKYSDYYGWTTTEKSLYSNIYYIIYDERKNVVSLSELINDYRKSRKLNKKENSYQEKEQIRKFHRSTQSFRNEIKSERKTYKGFISEIKQSITAKEYKVKIRAERKSILKCYIWDRYDDYKDTKNANTNKTWKNKKIDKQWNKKAS